MNLPPGCSQVCGSPDIPLHLLKSVATYKGVEPSVPLIQWFWEVMESFSNTERSLFLRFVWGRTRLPRTIADFRGRDFVVQVGVSLNDWEMRFLHFPQKRSSLIRLGNIRNLHAYATPACCPSP